MNMRAILVKEVGDPDKVVIEEIASPTPGLGEVLLDMKAAAVNFPDLLTVEGKYQFIPRVPFSPGKEGAGVVAALGDGVTDLKVGDRVMVQVEFGSYAEQMAVPVHDCYPMPDEIGFDEAAAVGVAFQTAHFALVERAHVKAGDTVLITAATGSVGIAAMQLSKAFGCTVLAGVTTMSKADIATENGADHIIDLTVDNPRDSIRDQVKAVTGGGVDVILEIVGGQVFEGCLRALNWRGSLVVVGFTSGEIATMKTNYTLLKNISVTGLDWSSYRDADPAWVRRVQNEIFDMCVAKKISMPVQATFPMEDVVKAFDIIRNREIRGKVVIRMGDG
jgi:NADPH:quinone reductase